MEPETQYTRMGDAHIAYQVMGSGPPDLVFTAGSFSGMDALWDDPGAALFLRRLASMARLIRFDRLGVGGSDRVAPGEHPDVSGYADEMEAVLDAVGSDRGGHPDP